MEGGTQQIGTTVQKLVPHEAQKRAKELITKHSDVLWALPLLSALTMTLRGLENAKDKKPAWAVANTLGAIFSLISATSGLKTSEALRRKPQKAQISDDMRQRILDAIREARESGRI